MVDSAWQRRPRLADLFGSDSAATVAFENLLIAGIRATPGLTKAALRFDIE